MEQKDIIIRVESLSKRFLLHTQGGAVLEVLRDIGVTAGRGECVVLNGPSGAGKSSLIRCIYGNYRTDSGRILVWHDEDYVDLAKARPRDILDIRSRTLGYVSQFLRVIPRVPTLDLVAQPLQRGGIARAEARDRAAAMLSRLNSPERLWSLAPATFSGGEQQRVNIARGFAVDYPVLLLDEPTASLDAGNRAVVVGLIQEAKARGAAVVGIFHDDEVRQAVADRLFDLTKERTAA